MRAVLLFLTLAVTSVLGCEQVIESCTSASAIAKDVNVYSDPAWSTIANGVTYTSYTSFTLPSPAQITGGKDHLLAKWNGITVKDETTDLCTDLKDTDIPCPVQSGDHLSATSATVSGLPSSGVLESWITWSDASGNEILCLHMVNCLDSA